MQDKDRFIAFTCPMVLVFSAIATLFHLYAFVMESLLWGRPQTNRTFGVTNEQAKAMHLMAFNQGFYNLFLAIAAAIGIATRILYGSAAWPDTLLIYACASMTGAGLILLYSNPKLIKASAIQAGPPALAILFWFFGY